MYKQPNPNLPEPSDERENFDDFTQQRIESQERRRRNRQSSAAYLRGLGISFTVHNKEAHLIVTHGGQVVDFWPGTGKWIARGSRAEGRGVRNLVSLLRKVAEKG